MGKPMTGDEFGRLMTTLGLNRPQAAELFQLTDRMIRYYSEGTYKVPFTLALVLRALNDQTLTVEYIRRVGPELKARR
jgi:hypothetical protein